MACWGWLCSSDMAPDGLPRGVQRRNNNSVSTRRRTPAGRATPSGLHTPRHRFPQTHMPPYAQSLTTPLRCTVTNCSPSQTPQLTRAVATSLPMAPSFQPWDTPIQLVHQRLQPCSCVPNARSAHASTKCSPAPHWGSACNGTKPKVR